MNDKNNKIHRISKYIMQTHSEYHGYFLTECIKQNEDGTVYIGQTGEKTAAELVIKIFNTQLILLRDRQRFLQEANVLASLRHPALLPLLDVGIDKGKPYLIREYAPEGSLITQLLQQDELAFSLPTIMAILTRIGAAITYLHQEQIYHGSIKPENILFDINRQAVLADVYIASIHPDIPSTVVEPVLTERGLILWKQPVTVQNDRQSKMQADIYALSSIAYELLTGYQPFTSAGEQDMAPVPPSHWKPSLPQRVDQVFLHALSPYPEERFSSATLFVEALRIALDVSIKEENIPLPEQQIVFQPPVEQRQLVPLQQPIEQRQLIPFQQRVEQRQLVVRRTPSIQQQSSFGRDLLIGLAALRSLLFVRQPSYGQSSGKGNAGTTILPIKLLLIILAALLVLASILVPFFLFHPRSNPDASHNVQNQALSRHVVSTATSRPRLTVTPTTHQGPAPTATSIPDPTPGLTPVPTPVFTAVPVPTTVNASFETPVLNGGYAYAPNNSGWTFSNDCGIASNGSALTQGTNNAPAGVQVAFIQAYGTVSQNVSFAQGTYTISFLAAQRVSSLSAQSLEVLIDNTVVGTFTPTGGNYLYYTTSNFIVGPGIHTLQFRGLKGGAHNTVFIDSVNVLHV